MVKKKQWWKWILVIVVVITVVITSFLYHQYRKFEQNFTNTQIEYKSKARKKSDDKLIENKRPISLLLLGVDERQNDSGRSDSIVVATLNPTQENAKLISIPRDTYVAIAGMEMSDKINHAYAFKGINGATETVEQLLNIPIDYVMTMNMEGLIDLVDLTGGITIDSPFAFKANLHTFNKGKNHLNGEAALAYARMRKNDPNGDFGRQERQKQVIAQLANNIKSFNTLAKLDEMMIILGSNIKTNIEMKELNRLRTDYLMPMQTYDNLQFNKGQGTTKNGIYYFELNTQELEQISATLQKHLAL